MATIQGSPNTAAATSVTIPTHAVGDLIVIFAYNTSGQTAISKPSASGTVPAWNDIDRPTGANTNSSATVYFVATATNHTSGTWGNSDLMIALVIRGQAASPIGGHAEAGSLSTNSATAPSVTMTATNGSSLLLEFMGHRSSTGFTAWSAAPAGYTQQAALVSSTQGVLLITKNDTTSDGSVTNNNNGTSSTGYRGATVEILASPGQFFAMF